MHSDDLPALRQAAPFAPFRIRLTDGSTFEVRHPELLFLSPTSASIFTISKVGREVSQRLDIVLLSMIEIVEPINATRLA